MDTITLYIRNVCLPTKYLVVEILKDSIFTGRFTTGFFESLFLLVYVDFTLQNLVSNLDLFVL